MSNQIINLTPHAIDLFHDNKLFCVFESKGILRLHGGMKQYKNKQVQLGETQFCVPIRYISEYTKLSGVEEDLSENDIIVSSLVAEFLMKNRGKYKWFCKRVLVPDTDPKSVIRDEDGKIIGIRAFIQYGRLDRD